VTKEQNGLKNKTTKAAKKMNESDRRGDAWLTTTLVSVKDCERLRGDFIVLRTTYQDLHGFANVSYRIGIEEEIKTDTKSFFRYVGNAWACEEVVV
jgi:hypothetical protein